MFPLTGQYVPLAVPPQLQLLLVRFAADLASERTFLGRRMNVHVILQFSGDQEHLVAHLALEHVLVQVIAHVVVSVAVTFQLPPTTFD